MKNRLPKELVTIPLTDMDFIALELDINNCNVEVKWLRRVNHAEFRYGLSIVALVTSQLKKELKRTYALCAAMNQRSTLHLSFPDSASSKDRLYLILACYPLP